MAKCKVVKQGQKVGKYPTLQNGASLNQTSKVRLDYAIERATTKE